MEKEAVTRSWDATTNLQLSPASLPAPPYRSPTPKAGGGGDGERGSQLVTGDRHYFMHGEIIAMTAITLFLIFLLFLIVPCIRRATSSTTVATTSEDSSRGKKRNWLLRLMLRKRRYGLETSGEASDAEKNYVYGVHRHWNS